MKKRMSLQILVSCALSLLCLRVSAQQPPLTKTIEKSFEVDSEVRVEIENSFGEVAITSWDEPTVAVKVEVMAYSHGDNRAREMLESINIDFSEGRYRLVMTTDIEINTKGDEKFEVNYEVKVPDSNKLKIGNSFGDIVMGERRESVDIDLAYGHLNATRLSGGGEIQLAFGGGQIDLLREGEVSLRYAEYFVINEATTLYLDEEHSEVEIGEVKDLELRARFGQITIGSADVIEGELEFTDFSLETLSGAIKVDCKHTSNFTIDNVLASFSGIDIDANFGSYKIDLENGLSANFEGRFQFADLRSPGVDMDFSRKIREKNNREYAASIGKGNPDKVIRIYSTHGNLQLTQ